MFQYKYKKQKNNPLAINSLLIFVYFAFVLFFFNLFVDPYLKEESILRFGADSLLYMKEYLTITDDKLFGDGGTNYLGPVLICRLFNNNTINITVFNFILFCTSYFLLINSANVNQRYLLLSLIASPMLLVSITTVNKEIIGSFFFSFLAYILQNKILLKSNKFSTFLIILIASLLALVVRWQTLVVLWTFLLMKYLNIKTSKSKLKFLFSLVLISSILYPTFKTVFELDMILTETNIDVIEKNEIMVALNQMQGQYMFFIVFIPKMLLNLIGNPFSMHAKIVEIFYGNSYDIYNVVISPLQQILNAFISIIFAYKTFKSKGHRKELTDIQCMIIIYGIVFSLTPFLQARYFFPIFTLMCLETFKEDILCKEDSQNNTLSIR
jgi:hypothetical protein